MRKRHGNGLNFKPEAGPRIHCWEIAVNPSYSARHLGIFLYHFFDTCHGSNKEIFVLPAPFLEAFIGRALANFGGTSIMTSHTVGHKRAFPGSHCHRARKRGCYMFQ